MSGARSNPFSPRVALALVLGGALAFMALLWAVGSGMADPQPQPSGAHAAGKGLTGFAALSAYLTARGYEVSQTRTRAPHQRGGLLVLTPQHQTKAADLARAIADHRRFGPTLLIMPKWLALPFPASASAVNPKLRPGFVRLFEASAPQWKGFHDEVSVELAPLSGDPASQRWHSQSLGGPMPAPGKVVSGKGGHLIPLVTAGGEARLLAGYFADGGRYPELAAQALAPVPVAAADDEEEQADDGPITVEGARPEPMPIEVSAAPPPRFPLVVVFDPDLLNNYGMGNQANAMLAERLVQAALGRGDRHVVFDLTLAGYAR